MKYCICCLSSYFSKIKITLNLLIVLCFTEIYFKEQLSPHSSIGRAIDL